jgi:flagellin-like protein
MKANQFLRKTRADDAVSPVIAVILMVAITVVLAATVYVWVSGFSANGTQAKTISLSSGTTSGGLATFTVSSVSPSTNWNNLKISLTGVTAGSYGILLQTVSATAPCSSFQSTAQWVGSTRLTGGNCPASAGDLLRIGAGAGFAGTPTLQIIDTSANSVIASVPLPALTAVAVTNPDITACAHTAATATLANPVASQTLANSAVIQPSDLNGAGGTSFTYALGTTSITALNAAPASAGTMNFVTGHVWDIYGNALSNAASPACSA